MAEIRISQAALLVELDAQFVRASQAALLVEIDQVQVRVSQCALLIEIEYVLPETETEEGSIGGGESTATSRAAKAPAPTAQTRPVSSATARAGNALFAALAVSRATVAPTTIIATGAQTAGAGMSTTRQVRIAVQVDWSRSGAWVDESSRVVSVQGQHSLVAPDALLAGGRGAVATARVTLANDDGRFSAGVATSPLFSMLTAGIFSAPVRIDVTIDEVTQRVFTGVVRELSETGGTATTPASATLECRGRDELLLNDLRSTPLADFLADNSQAHTEDFHIVRLLEAGGLVDGTDFVTHSYAAGHPGVPPTIDSGIFPIRYVWLDDESVLDQLWKLVAACGGWFYCDADGKLHYHNLTAITPAALAQHYGTQTTLALAESNVAGVTIARPTRELYSDVTVETALRQPVPTAEFWTPDATITVQPGESRTIWATLSAPLAEAPTLTAQAVDARGAALAGVTATPTYYAQRVRLDLANATGKTAYFTVLRLSGRLLDSAAAVEIEMSSAATFWSGRPRRRRRIKQNIYIQSDTQATTLARYFLRRQEQPQPQVTAQNIDRADIRLGHPVAITYKDAIASTQTITGIVASLDWRGDRSGYRQNITILETGSLLAAYTPFFVLATHRLGASGTDTANLFY